MKIKVFMTTMHHIEQQLGNDVVTLEQAFKLIESAEIRFAHLGIQSFEIYQLEASIPFKVPADTSNLPVSSAILSTSQESSR